MRLTSATSLEKEEAVGCEGCGAVATIKELDDMYAQIIVKMEQSEARQREQIELLTELLMLRFERLYPTAYKYQD